MQLSPVAVGGFRCEIEARWHLLTPAVFTSQELHRMVYRSLVSHASPGSKIRGEFAAGRHQCISFIIIQ